MKMEIRDQDERLCDQIETDKLVKDQISNLTNIYLEKSISKRYETLLYQFIKYILSN